MNPDRTHLQQQNIFDGLSVVCAIGGAVAATLTQSAAAAAFPLAGAIGVHIFNRRQLMDNIAGHYEKMIRDQNLHIVNHQEKITYLNDRLEALQGELELVNGRLSLEASENSEKLTDNIDNLARKIDSYEHLSRDLAESQEELTRIVRELREITNVTQEIALKPESAETYYLRAINLQKAGDNEGAIVDFNRAIELDPDMVKAYHSRGVLHATLGNRKGAVEDLRQASKLYFENDDLENYNLTRELSREIYNMSNGNTAADNSPAPEKTIEPAPSEEILVGGLFDSN